jgi:CheY-like chemotaxis protein
MGSVGNHKILVVEDDKFLRRACSSALTQRGFSVVVGVDGEEGISLAKSHLPDLILLDLIMPGMTGFDVIDSLKGNESTAGIPILVISNSSADEGMQRAIKMGANGYIVKSNISLDSLCDSVSVMLEQQAETGA